MLNGAWRAIGGGAPYAGQMDPDDIWLRSTSPFVLTHLPPAPARVIELGCGEQGGHVPALRRAGYDVVGVDPRSPDGPEYSRVPFEEHDAGEPVDAVIASLSLHHVADLDAVLDRIRGALVARGTLVVLEWARERFDEATAQWCFNRLAPDDAEEDGWLRRRQAEWEHSGLPWERFCHDWAQAQGIHPAAMIRRGLDARFTLTHESWGPYYFPELAATDETDEQAAIDAGQIRACCLRYVGQRAA
jgi:SAM-dependent methyltransferase